MLDKICTEMDKGCLGGVVFVYLEKAFDTVNHDILLHKLSSIGISTGSWWFASYLHQWQQLTRIDGSSSDLHIVSHGVPQGLILGPLLFLIIINDLCDIVELCGTSMHADDMAIFTMSTDLDKLKLSMQYDLQSISHWMVQNWLCPNVSKTKLMMLGTRQKLSGIPEIGLSLNGELIDNVVPFKYLGMILQPQLLFKVHINALVNKTINTLGSLYKTWRLFDKDTALALYKSLTMPHFDYGLILYEVAPQCDLNQLQIIQTAAARLILLVHVWELFGHPVCLDHHDFRQLP